jgi:hypothetical protein
MHLRPKNKLECESIIAAQSLSIIKSIYTLPINYCTYSHPLIFFEKKNENFFLFTKIKGNLTYISNLIISIRVKWNSIFFSYFTF